MKASLGSVGHFAGLFDIFRADPPPSTPSSPPTPPTLVSVPHRIRYRGARACSLSAPLLSVRDLVIVPHLPHTLSPAAPAVLPSSSLQGLLQGAAAPGSRGQI